MSEDETVVLDLNLAEVAKMVAAFRTDQPRLLVAEIAPPSLWGVVDTHVILLIAPAVAPPLVATPLIAPPLALLAPPLVEDRRKLPPLSPPWPPWQYSGVTPLLG